MPIDLVIPLVFASDPNWQKDYLRSHNIGGIATKHVRFRSWGTEELLMQCIMRNMGWLRKVHLLLASPSQVQPWMQTLFSRKEEGTPVFVPVYHAQFIPSGHLPTFNICTIEMFLHRIPDLSEQFIYSNDDFFPLSPLAPSDFFRDGLPCQHFDERPFTNHPNIFEKFVKGGLDMVAADFGRTFKNTWLRGGHSMQSMLRSTVEEVYNRHKDRISNSFTQVRSERNFNQYIFPFYQHLSGKYVDHVPKHRYVGPRTPTSEFPSILREKDPGILSINDNVAIEDWQVRAAIVRRELATRLTGENIEE